MILQGIFQSVLGQVNEEKEVIIGEKILFLYKGKSY